MSSQSLKSYYAFIHTALFLTILLFSTYILIDRLVLNPPGFFIDEAINGTEAYSILHNKGYSTNREFLPRYFQNPDTWARSHTSFIYVLIPFIQVLGLNAYAVRLPTVICSLILLWLLYVFLKDKISRKALFLTLIWWPLTAWVFLLSRNGVELFFACLIAFASFMALCKSYEIPSANKSKTMLYVSLLGVLNLMLFFSHSAGKLLSLGYFGLGFCIQLARYFQTRRTHYLQALAILAAFLGMTFLLVLPYLKDGTFFYRSDELRAFCPGTEINCFIGNLGSHFNLASYFGKGYQPKDFYTFRHSVPETTLIPLILAPFLAFGLLGFMATMGRKVQIHHILLPLVFMIGIIPTSLTFRGFDSWRSYTLLPLIFVLIAYGFDSIITLSSLLFRRGRSILSLLLIPIGIIGILFASHEYKTLRRMEYSVDAAGYSGWEYGYQEIFEYSTSVYDKYDKIYVTPSIAYVPELYIRFYDPTKRYPNIQIDTGTQDPSSDRILYVKTAEELEDVPFTTLKTIYYPDGSSPAFYIGKKQR